ncbi:hypothetical protein ACS0TY_017991 [Phlomoides rotata]
MATEENIAVVRPSGIDDKLLWSHVTILVVTAAGVGNRTWVCNYCSKKVVGSYSKRRPLINLMATSSGGTMFLKAIDASGIIKDGEYVSSLFEEAIKEVGESNVVQIITDNASNYKSAGSMIESRYPHIFWTHCVVHSLNLALKSICDPTERSPQYDQCKWISDLVGDV